MRFSKGIEYALHCLLYIVNVPGGRAVAGKDLAEYQGVSETYLAKVFAKLRKAGIVKSITGVSGGYVLAKSPEDISFLHIVEAIEGTSPMFQCAEIRQNEILLDKENLPDTHTKYPCLIHTVMLEAENQMKEYLKEKTLGWLHEQVKDKLPNEHLIATKEWFSNNANR